jgi:hypothetical protein
MTDVLQKSRTLTRFGFSVYDIARLITVEIPHITHGPLWTGQFSMSVMADFVNNRGFILGAVRTMPEMLGASSIMPFSVWWILFGVPLAAAASAWVGLCAHRSTERHRLSRVSAILLPSAAALSA